MDASSIHNNFSAESERCLPPQNKYNVRPLLARPD
ncbi:uncharacterized protein G2W53_008899 [Senna tora]|uniref:Uncharacterized protein n=1 Tax=Senna tora TaxID=362788 RepID=A0A834WXA2_9FABA|nr:uncharacterized protein G2W53_008899 [Senna tora]